MGQLEIYILLFGVIILIGQIFNKSPVPTSLLLVITGMVLSLIPQFPLVTLNPDLVLNIFLPVLVYHISSSSSWKDFKKNIRPIIQLSFGHVIFITVLVATVMHYLSPELSWPLAFVLGAVLAPPDDVAIVTIAEKVHLPETIFSILEGEALLNDATALILFRFALIAVVTNSFSPLHAASAFLFVVIGESLYGYILGTVLGEIRLRIQNPTLHMMASILTPFLAYIPAVKLGGCGVLATAVTGFMIGHRYSMRFTPEFRLLSHAIWPTLSFAIQCILFLLIGLDMRSILTSISSIPTGLLIIYGSAAVATVIIGRFIWVFTMVYLVPKTYFSSRRKSDTTPPWRFPFVVSWAGVRGSISLAAALAVPTLPAIASGINPRNLLVFLVFCVIIATLIIQGLSLPLIIRILGVHKFGLIEKYNAHVAELDARKKMVSAVLHWLFEYKKEVKNNPKLYGEVKQHISEYKLIRTHLNERITLHELKSPHDEKAEALEEVFLTSQIIEIERAELLRLWRSDKINLSVRNKLLEKLDHRAKGFPMSFSLS
ncbi:MAG: sodium:proton antiporter [Gammaproteobacteria bacterium]|nr:sodium:proton antiporter [Gammaproteobacteria bacterium]